ncbi:MAG: hypothetical protein HQ565_03130 [Bacteroidetes bacterium]|nr:hypothetical protein [Bacteroidota bacterium]
MNGNLPQKRSFALSPDRKLALLLEILLLMMAGALAAFMHFNIRIPLNIPGHHGLEFMAIFVLVRLTSNIRFAATASVLGVGILLLIPGIGTSSPMHSLSYLLPGLMLDAFYQLNKKQMHLLFFTALIAGISYMSIPLSRWFIHIFTAYPYMSFIKFGTAYTLMSFFLFGMLGGMLGYGLNSIKSSFTKNK